MTDTQVAKTKTPSLVETMAGRFGVESNKLLTTLKNTAFSGKNEPTNEEMMALLVVANEYGLNPFTKEIYAFPDKHKGIVPVVGVDGWARICNDHKAFDGMAFKYADEMVTNHTAQPCPIWIEAVIYRKDRNQPLVVREYLDECYRPPFKEGQKGPWQTHTKRFLRHKAMIQCARLAFGFSGIYDEDEALRIVEGGELEDHMEGERPRREDYIEHAPEASDNAENASETTSDPVYILLDQFGEQWGEFSLPEAGWLEEFLKLLECFDNKQDITAFVEHNAEVLREFKEDNKDSARQTIKGRFEEMSLQRTSGEE